MNMELYGEIVCHMLRDHKIEIRFPDLGDDIVEQFHTECYRTLRIIQRIIRDNSLNDKECFQKIEEIVCLFEERGFSCGGRHDF